MCFHNLLFFRLKGKCQTHFLMHPCTLLSSRLVHSPATAWNSRVHSLAVAWVSSLSLWLNRHYGPLTSCLVGSYVSFRRSKAIGSRPRWSSGLVFVIENKFLGFKPGREGWDF
jgi:hypothetical protein